MTAQNPTSRRARNRARLARRPVAGPDASVQLALEGLGDPVPLSALIGKRARLGPRQRAVLDELGRRGSLTSTQAGRIVHAARGHCGSGARDSFTHEYAGAGCCPYAVSDGAEVLYPLAARGLVEMIGGVWYSTLDEAAA